MAHIPSANQALDPFIPRTCRESCDQADRSQVNRKGVKKYKWYEWYGECFGVVMDREDAVVERILVSCTGHFEREQYEKRCESRYP